MTDRELKKLSRAELLEIMLDQSREIDRLNSRVTELERKLAEKRIDINEAGSIAEASLRLNRIFEAAQRAADQYVYSVKSRYEI